MLLYIFLQVSVGILIQLHPVSKIINQTENYIEKTIKEQKHYVWVKAQTIILFLMHKNLCVTKLCAA